MRMTTVLNLYGAPGSGKSTLAADIFSAYKKDRGPTVEMVREHVKEFVWQGHTPTVWDELWFFGKQIQREVILYGKVDLLVTDKPLLMHAFYAEINGLTEMAEGLLKCIKAHRQEMTNHGYRVSNLFIERKDMPYEEAGRLQSEEEARELEKRLLSFIGRVDPEGDYTMIHPNTPLSDIKGSIRLEG